MAALPVWLEPFANARVGQLIDHTLLKAETTESEVLRLCDEAIELGLGAVCVNGQWVPTVARRLHGTSVITVGVAGFPLGATGATAKAEETKHLVDAGAGEIDVVQSLGFARAGNWKEVQRELEAVVRAADCPVKVILETAALTESEIVESCRAAKVAGAQFVKTSTGFHSAGGASAESVALMRKCVGPAMGVKASGGVRTPQSAQEMLSAGADRIGTSSAAKWNELIGRTVISLFS